MTDVLIAGGGPAGLAAAIALAERGVAVTVADPAMGVAQPRAELLAHGAKAIMDRLGLGATLATAHVVRDVQSRWGTAGLQAHGAMPGLGVYGWGVDRRALSRDMRTRAKALGVQLVHASLRSTETQGEGWRVRLSCAAGQQVMQVSILLDATGRASRIARRQGAIARHGPDLVAAIWHVPSTQGHVMQAEAAHDGWWYAVPLDDGATIGFVGSARSAKAAGASPAAFLKAADARLARVVAQAGAVRPRLMDCRSAILDRTCGPGWLATGDAACAFDPISSQGVFNALSSGFFAGQAAADALAGDADAPLVFEALVKRTAEYTHARTHLQYAALPYDTPFWRQQARAGHENPAHRVIPA
ncbi:tryptophan 7-halogenase [uncultured Tateyamaria sp.]|uniref:tryptophan 7-halogenase n=1 Tax=uncultured Tateyamaria sp. TaxID=455651 RepID=UPI002603EE04|nr:tryptophan 7-halogenase [uncultured Tateyamaria sp.]